MKLIATAALIAVLLPISPAFAWTHHSSQQPQSGGPGNTVYRASNAQHVLSAFHSAK